MSGGGKGGSQTTQVTIPPWVREAAQNNLARADRISEIGYVPYYGPDVAAFQPSQTAAFQNTANAAGAFGMQGGMPNMPEAQTFAPGVQGYSSAPVLEAAMEELQVRRPGQFNAINSMFIDPYSGGPGGYAGGGGHSAGQQRYDDFGNPMPGTWQPGVREDRIDSWTGPQGSAGKGSNPFAPGGIFGDGGFFDDTRFDLGLIDGEGRLGSLAGGGREGGGGGAGKGG